MGIRNGGSLWLSGLVIGTTAAIQRLDALDIETLNGASSATTTRAPFLQALVVGPANLVSTAGNKYHLVSESIHLCIPSQPRVLKSGQRSRSTFLVDLAGNGSLATVPNRKRIDTI